MEKAERDDSYPHILRYTGLFGGVQGLNIMVSLVRNKLVAMLLGPDGMGLVSLFNSTLKLLSDTTNLGIPMSGVKNVSEAYDQGDRERLLHTVRLIRSWSLFTGLVGMLLCIVLGPFFSRWTFSWGDHTLHFILLSPVVLLTAVSGGEFAILKGTRQLKHLAFISLLNVVAALVLTVPLYYFWWQQAIVPSIIIMALSQLVITIVYSYRLFPFSVTFGRKQLHEGVGMIRLGTAFVLAGFLGSGADFLIRCYMNYTTNLMEVGLFNAGYMMTMTYAGMVFSAMETDYFPRLSAIMGCGPQLNQVVNQQIEVCLLLVAPLLVLFMVFLPILLPLLYSGKFMPVAGMMRLTLLAMYFRAISLPIEYIALSKGDSKAYLFVEAVGDVMVVGLVIAGFSVAGLTGTGYGLALSGLLNLVFVVGFTRFRYGYLPSRSVRLYMLLLFPIGLLACVACLLLTGWLYWAAGIALSACSLALSLRILHSKTHLWDKLTAKMRRIRQRGRRGGPTETDA